jgi:iron(III) transport system permease protein
MIVWGLRSSRTVIVVLALVAFALFCLAPVAAILASAFGGSLPADSPAIRPWLDVRQRTLLFNTATLGLGAAVCATMVGVPLGFALARVPLPQKSVMRIALAAPALFPPYVVALAWTYLVTPLAGERAYSAAGAIVVLTVVFYPISMLATEAALRRVESRLEEAAFLVATPMVVLRRITLPLSGPSIVAAGLVIFVLAVSEFGVPGVLRVRVFTTEVFTAFAALYDARRAMVFALPLGALSLMTVTAAAILVREQRMTSRHGHANGTAVLFESWTTPAVKLVAIVVIIALVVPLAILAAEAQRAASIGQALRESQPAVLNSLGLAAIGASAVTALGATLGYVRARAGTRAGVFADALMIVVFTIPSTIIGIGLITFWNRSGVWGVVYGTAAMPVLGYLARFVPVATLAIAASVRSVPEAHEEAAALSGAGWARTTTRIVLPQIRQGLLAVWVVSFVLAFGEVGTTILVAPAGESTLPIRVYTLIANAPPGHVAALALFQSAVGFGPLMLLAGALSRRRPR